MLVGHKKNIDLLKKSIKNDRVAHAYLFTGPSHIGKRTVALEFIKMLTGQDIENNFCSDVVIVEPEETGSISIKQVRQVQKRVSRSSYERYKIVLIDSAEKMTPEASNCLLKVLEEPQGQTVLILVSSKPKYLLPTIVSRCRIIKFFPVCEKEMRSLVSSRLSDSKTSQIIRLSNGRPGLFFDYLNNPDMLEQKLKTAKDLEDLIKSDLCERFKYAENMAKDNLQAKETLSDWILYLRDLILINTDCSDLAIYNQPVDINYSLARLKDVIKVIKQTELLISNPSINARLALESMMLEF